MLHPRGGEPWGLSALPKGGRALGTKCSAQGGGEPWGLSAPPKGGESPEKSEMDRKLDSHRAVAMDKIAV